MSTATQVYTQCKTKKIEHRQLQVSDVGSTP